MKTIRQNAHLLRYYSKLFRFRDAVALIRKNTSPNNLIEIFSTELQRHIFLRPNTSDLPVILKVIGAREYDTPTDFAPKLIIDAGANIGIATLFFARRYPNAYIHAIEPEDSNFALLEKNCVGLKNVTLHKAALWNRSAKVSFRDANAEKWSFSVQEGSSASSTIPTITIPQLLEVSNCDTIDILKIDIEGGEKELFSIEANQWLHRVRSIIIELHDRFVPGCSQAFYSAIQQYNFSQEVCGENVIINLARNSQN